MARNRAINRVQVTAITNDLQEFVVNTNQLIARRLVRALRDATPVDTGHAASNWIGQIGSPFAGVAGSKQAVNFGPQNASLRTLNARNRIIREVFVSNNVEYVDVLNTGTSTQAPSGFIQAAISRVQVPPV